MRWIGVSTKANTIGFIGVDVLDVVDAIFLQADAVGLIVPLDNVLNALADVFIELLED